MITQLNFSVPLGASEADFQGIPALSEWHARGLGVPFVAQMRLSGPAWIAQWRIDLLRGGGGPADGSWLSLLHSSQTIRSTITPSTYAPTTVDWIWLADGPGIPLLSSAEDCTPQPPSVSWRLTVDAAAPADARVSVSLYLLDHKDIVT